ncbi:MAG: hypothetical protein KAW14_00475 [Candidatus Aegiribacteria sp.]|nr:hypothetical protein [Candidatus Aegiribacteria sp.]
MRYLRWRKFSDTGSVIRTFSKKHLHTVPVPKAVSSGDNYERLEFLGDAVLELVTREYLMTEYPQESEGYLTRRKIKIVMKQNLARHGRRLRLNHFVQVGSGFDASDRSNRYYCR